MQFPKIHSQAALQKNPAIHENKFKKKKADPRFRRIRVNYQQPHANCLTGRRHLFDPISPLFVHDGVFVDLIPGEQKGGWDVLDRIPCTDLNPVIWGKRMFLLCHLGNDDVAAKWISCSRVTPEDKNYRWKRKWRLEIILLAPFSCLFISISNDS